MASEIMEHSTFCSIACSLLRPKSKLYTTSPWGKSNCQGKPLSWAQQKNLTGLFSCNLWSNQCSSFSCRYVTASLDATNIGTFTWEKIVIHPQFYLKTSKVIPFDCTTCYVPFQPLSNATLDDSRSRCSYSGGFFECSFSRRMTVEVPIDPKAVRNPFIADLTLGNRYFIKIAKGNASSTSKFYLVIKTHTEFSFTNSLTNRILTGKIICSPK